MIAVLTETYSASALAASGSMPCPDRSHDSILLAVLSRSALKIAHQAWLPRLLLRRLSRRLQTGVRAQKRYGALTCQVRLVAMGLAHMGVEDWGSHGGARLTTSKIG